MDHVERLVETGGGASDAWAALRAAVVDAARKSDLRVAEDQVDAVVCAYVALFADRWPERTTRYGDLATGYIVTPSLVTDVAAAAVRTYAADHAELEEAGRARGRPGRRDPRRGRHQLPERRRPGQGHRLVRGEGEPDRRRAPALPRPAARHRRPARRPRHHLRRRRRRGRRRPARRPARGPRRPGPRRADGQRGPVRLRLAPPPGGDRRARGAGAAAHRAPARVGRVRARHPLQGQRAARARQRVRPAVHPRRRAARARRPGVLRDPRPAARTGAGGRARRTTTRGSRPASWRRSWPGSTPTRAGRAPTTTPGSPGSCSSSASPAWPSSPRCCGAPTTGRSSC